MKEIFWRLDEDDLSRQFQRVFIQRFLYLGLALWVFLLGGTAVSTAAEPEKAVVRIYVSRQAPDWDEPWRFEMIGRTTGSGFVIEGEQIMTNAHVVSWARQILVQKYQDPKLYLARVKFVGHDCDLAILEVQDTSFFKGIEPLKFGKLPKVRSTVTTYGYPAGGAQISYTRGVVSRVEMGGYSHIGNRSFLQVQTDAAINPGNSGGPVIQDDLVVGVAFQKIGGGALESTGFFIPMPIVQHFLDDVKDGNYDGFPDAGISMVPLHSPAYRQFLQLPDDDLGARIDRVFMVPTTKEVLQPDDVLLKVGKYEVGRDATILFEGNRVNAGVAFDLVQHGDYLPLTIWRNGKKMEVSLLMKVQRWDAAEGNQHDRLPRYFIQGGLVFVPLSMDYLRTFGKEWSQTVAPLLYHELAFAKYENEIKARREPVVLSTVLSHRVNADMQIRGGRLVDKINGKRIESLEDIVQAFSEGQGEYDIIEFLPHHSFEALSRAEAEKAKDEILKTYSIAQDRRL